MYRIQLVANTEELKQIANLSASNLKTVVDDQTKKEQGFLTWEYTTDLLEAMHSILPCNHRNPEAIDRTGGHRLDRQNSAQIRGDRERELLSHDLLNTHNCASTNRYDLRFHESKSPVP